MGADAYVDQLSLYGLQRGRLWSRDLGGVAEVVVMDDLNHDGKHEVITGTELGQVLAFDGAGNRLFAADARAKVQSLAVTTSNGTKRICAGTDNPPIRR